MDKFHGLERNSGINYNMVQNMERQLLRLGLSTSRLDPGHKFINPRLKHYDKQCPICRVHFKSINLRCPKCDIIVPGKKPTGNDEEQKKFMTEYAESAHLLEKQRKQIRQHRRDTVKDGRR